MQIKKWRSFTFRFRDHLMIYFINKFVHMQIFFFITPLQFHYNLVCIARGNYILCVDDAFVGVMWIYCLTFFIHSALFLLLSLKRLSLIKVLKSWFLLFYIENKYKYQGGSPKKIINDIRLVSEVKIWRRESHIWLSHFFDAFQ